MDEKKYTIEFTKEELEYLEDIIDIAWHLGYPPSSSIWYQFENIKKEANA